MLAKASIHPAARANRNNTRTRPKIDAGLRQLGALEVARVAQVQGERTVPLPARTAHPERGVVEQQAEPAHPALPEQSEVRQFRAQDV